MLRWSYIFFGEYGWFRGNPETGQHDGFYSVYTAETSFVLYWDMSDGYRKNKSWQQEQIWFTKVSLCFISRVTDLPKLLFSERKLWSDRFVIQHNKNWRGNGMRKKERKNKGEMTEKEKRGERKERNMKKRVSRWENGMKGKKKWAGKKEGRILSFGKKTQSYIMKLHQ